MDFQNENLIYLDCYDKIQIQLDCYLLNNKTIGFLQTKNLEVYMGIAILITFGVIVVFVMAFKRNTSETTVTRKDENGNIITEHHETVHHTAGQSAVRFVVGLLFTIVLIVVILFATII